VITEVFEFLDICTSLRSLKVTSLETRGG